MLVLAHRGEDLRHAAAVEVVRGLAEGDRLWAIPAPCVSEFVRVVTHRAFAVRPHTLGEAAMAVRSLLRSPQARLLLPLPGFHEVLLSVLEDAKATGNLVYDAQIVAVCRQHGVRRLVSEDRDMRRFRDVEAIPLAAFR